MEFEEYQREVFTDWRNRLFSASFTAIIILCFVYVAVFFIFLLTGNFEQSGESPFWYVIQRIVIPLAICFSSFFTCKALCKKCNVDYKKNLYAMRTLTTVATVITIFNNYFVLVFAVPTISVIASLSFGNKKLIMNNLLFIYIGLLVAFFTFAVDPVHTGQYLYISTTIGITVIYYFALSVFAMSLATVNKKTIDIAHDSLKHREVLLNKLNLDSLTGLYNKGYLTQYLATIIGKPNYYLAIMDLDHFKSVNDKYGHLSGDEILVRFAHIVDFQTKFDTHSFRFGGDEFVIVYKGQQQDFLTILGNISQELKSQVFDFADDLKLTASIGVTAILPSDSTESVFERSDKLMYQAKNTGRDRCINDFQM